MVKIQILGAHLKTLMEPDCRLTTKETFILSFLISYGKGYGLELVKKSDGLLKRGSVYVTLNCMQENGYIRARKEVLLPDEKGPVRRHYVATAKGAQALDTWKLLRSFQLGAWITIT